MKTWQDVFPDRTLHGVMSTIACGNVREVVHIMVESLHSRYPDDLSQPFELSDWSCDELKMIYLSASYRCQYFDDLKKKLNKKEKDIDEMLRNWNYMFCDDSMPYWDANRAYKEMGNKVSASRFQWKSFGGLFTKLRWNRGMHDKFKLDHEWFASDVQDAVKNNTRLDFEVWIPNADDGQIAEQITLLTWSNEELKNISIEDMWQTCHEIMLGYEYDDKSFTSRI